jgi:hypothetical protein
MVMAMPDRPGPVKDFPPPWQIPGNVNWRPAYSDMPVRRIRM